MFRVSRLCGEDPSSVRCVLLLNLSLLLPTTLPVWKAKGCSEQPGRQSLNLLHMHLKDKRQGLRTVSRGFRGQRKSKQDKPPQSYHVQRCLQVPVWTGSPQHRHRFFRERKQGGSWCFDLLPGISGVPRAPAPTPHQDQARVSHKINLLPKNRSRMQPQPGLFHEVGTHEFPQLF